MRPSRRFWILGAVVAGALALSAALRRPGSGPAEAGSVPARIVSLAPSSTETLYALGLGDRLVGVCDYCEYPPEVKSKARLGGYYTPNFEALLEAKPDLVVLLPEHLPVRDKIRELGFRTLDVDHRGVGGILDSLRVIGEACGVAERAAALRRELEARMERAKARAGGRRRPRVLISVGRAMNEGGVLRITTCGRGGFYDNLLDMAGGVNPYEGSVPYPALSPEGVLALKPDLIVEIMPDLRDKGVTEEGILKDWAGLPGLGAVPVKVIAKPYSIVPGPRFVNLLEDLAAALHPDAGP
jgi:iron complex transport system substrate-binding protein